MSPKPLHLDMVSKGRMGVSRIRTTSIVKNHPIVLSGVTMVSRFMALISYIYLFFFQFI